MPLTLGVAVKLGPILFLTALRHFLEKSGVTEPSGSKAKEELLYDEVGDHFYAYLIYLARPLFLSVCTADLPGILGCEGLLHGCK